MFSLLVSIQPLNAQTGWYSPASTSDVLNTVCFVDSLNGWVGGWVGNAGVIRKTIDGGITWKAQPYPGTEVIKKIRFLNSMNGFASGTSGLILKTTDGGQTWVKLPSGTIEDVNSILFINNQKGWACAGRYLLQTSDGGNTWSSRTFRQYGDDFRDIAFVNALEGLMVGMGSIGFETKDGGTTWVQSPGLSDGTYSVQYISRSRIVIACEYGILLSTDGGQTVEWANTPTRAKFTSVSFADSLKGWAVSTAGIIKTIDGGAHWNSQTSPQGANAVYTPDGIHVWAVGWQSILKTIDQLSVDYTRSTISANPTTLKADGKSFSLITMQLNDRDSLPFSSSQGVVELKTTIGSLSVVTDQKNGRYSAIFTASSIAGTAVVSAALNGVPFTRTVSLKIKSDVPSLTRSVIFPDPSFIPADGKSSTEINVQLRDEGGFDIFSSQGKVTLSTTAGTLGNVIDYDDGTYSAVLTSSLAADTAIITGTLNGNPISQRAAVVFTGIAPVESELFPLRIGNKWFYRYAANQDKGFVVREIIDTTADGYRKVSVTSYLQSGVKNSTEYWSFTEGRFYITTAPVITVSDMPVYVSSLLNDSSWGSGFYYSYSLKKTEQTYLGTRYTTQFLTSYGQGKVSFTQSIDGIAVGIGLAYFHEHWAYIGYSPLSNYDTLILVGFVKNSVLRGDSTRSLTSVGSDKWISMTYQLDQNYPNPFNPSTTISFTLPSRSFVTLKIFDVMGREIASIVSEEMQAGTYSRSWNAGTMTSGMYFYRLQAGAFTQTRRLLIVR
jgi:photosystem II stability/assembly factor-like uncharacterized protein